MVGRDMLVEIFKVLTYHLLTTDKQGWRVLEETLAYAYIFQERGLDLVNFLSAFHLKLLDTYTVEFERGNISLPSTLDSIKSGSGEKSSTAAIVLTNFVYLVRMVEEYLFYNRTISECSFNSPLGTGSGDHSFILSNNASVSSINGVDTANFPIPEISESFRLRKRIYSNAPPPLNTIFPGVDATSSGKMSPLVSSRLTMKQQMAGTPTTPQQHMTDFSTSAESSLASALQSGLYGSGDVSPDRKSVV